MSLNINRNKNIWKLTTQFIKFGIVGITNTAIGLIIYYIFVFISKDLYIAGNTIGFVVSVLNAYYWNNRFVFKKTEKGHIKPLIKTYLAYGSTFLLGTGFLFVMVNYLGISEMIAPMINLLFTVPLNFLLNRFWSFK